VSSLTPRPARKARTTITYGQMPDSPARPAAPLERQVQDAASSQYRDAVNRLTVIAAVASLTAMLLLTPVVRAAARRWGVVDRPNPRSSHSGVVPRAGGVALLTAVGLSLALAPETWWRSPAAVAFVAGALVLAIVGVCDDRWGLPPLLRLAIQVAVAGALVASAGGLEHLFLPPPFDLPLGPLGPPVSVLWIVAVVNFYNFMDGIDGLAGLQAVVTGTAIAVAAFEPFSSFLGAAVAGAAAGFLVFNWAPASIFLGDAGSSVLGYTLAALPFLAAPVSRPGMALLVALSLWFFLADATWTLLRRAARGARVHEAHREHLYQRLVISGVRHSEVSAGLGLAALGVTAVSLAAVRSGQTLVSWAAVLLAVVLFGLEVRLVRSREAVRGVAGQGEIAS
jgi:UDP-N-acetylmuramyl pentapeptide phosphotransferase/UDP-N-acetylglucosamine-1-phosphate transferase